MANVPEVASYQGVTSGLQDVLHFLETKGNMKDANELTEVITNVQSGRLNCNNKQRQSQLKLTDFFKTV